MERLIRIAAKQQLNPALMCALLLVPLLSILDYHLTMRILGRGGTEANPLMAGLLYTKPHLTFWLKLALTAGGATILAATARFRSSRAAAFILPLIYGAVILYEIVLLTVVMP